MMTEEKNDLVALLTNTHTATQTILDDIDLELIAHPDSGWRVRDIIGHCATWDNQAVKSLLAYNNGSEYAIQDLGNEYAFNQKECDRQRKLTVQQVLDEWEQTHEKFKDAVLSVPVEMYPGDLLYPWGDERGDVPLLVNYMCEHEEEHREEIMKAIQGG